MSLTREDPSLKKKLASILKKKAIIPSLKEEIQKNLIEFDIENLPLRFENFSSELPRVLEIGSGWGEFTIDFARQNPGCIIIALEKKKKRVIRCLKKQYENQLPNIRWMIVDVYWFFDELFASGTFDKIIINFPDPWPKLRHHKHRYMNPQFIATLGRVARKGCILEFATDFWPYMNEAVILLEESGLFENVHSPGRVLRELPSRPRSFFEQMKRDEGDQVFFIQFKRK